MYIHELECSWMDHPFARNQFLIDDVKDIAKISKAKIRFATIDTDKGLDVPQQKVPITPVTAKKPKKTAAASNPDIEQRLRSSKKLLNKATVIATKILGKVSSGEAVDMESTASVVDGITRMISTDPHTLVGVSRIKTKDEYTFQHSVSVCALITAFGQFMGYSKDQLDEISTGGLLHDIGKALTPNKILNKPGKLTDDEFVIMKQHAIKRKHELLDGCGLSDISLDIISMHHERPDGKGYPNGLKSEEMSQIGKMSAIVDIYDALISVRVYKSAWEPSEALKHMLSWCPHQLDLELMQKFIKMLGVYPVGSLVELKSGLVGIVIQPGENMLKPTLKIIYNANTGHYTEVRKMDLEKYQQEAIKAPISPVKYKIEMGKFI
jgi:putative nucleotidyltransferase with HDIG domain